MLNVYAKDERTFCLCFAYGAVVSLFGLKKDSVNMWGITPDMVDSDLASFKNNHQACKALVKYMEDLADKSYKEVARICFPRLFKDLKNRSNFLWAINKGAEFYGD